MALDPRIALQGASFQAPDILGAMRQGQEYRQNQMVMQTARDTAARNAMIRERAATVNPTDRAAVNQFVSFAGPDAAPYLEAWTGGDNMFNNRAGEARAEGKYVREARDSDQGFMQDALAAVYTDPSDANISAIRTRAIAAGIAEADFDAYAARFMAVPPEQRPALLANELATTEDGLKVLERFAPEWKREDRGGTIATVQMNPLAMGAAPPATAATTADPRAPQVIQTAQGFGQLSSDGNFTPVTGPDGAPVMPYVAPRAPAAGTNPDGTQAASADTLRDVLGQLKTNFDTLYENGFMRGEGVSPVGNLAQYVGDAIPGVRGARLSTNSAADTASGNVEALLSTAISTLSALYGTSSRVMDAVKEMENARSTFGGQNLTIEAARNMVDTALRRVDELEASRGGTGGGANLPPVGEEGARVRNRGTGAIMVSRGDRWVPE